MKKLLSSELIRYNANTRGTRTGDCTARAISLAFGIDYHKARKALNDSAKAHNLANKRPFWEYNSHSNCIEVIKQLGGGNLNENKDRTPVGSFADNHPSGTYIIWCSRDGISHAGNHLVTIIDGKVYDSWDSRNYKVKGYWTIKAGLSSKDISTDLPKAIKTFFDSKNTEDWNHYIVSVFDNIVQKNRRLKKLNEKYNTDINLSINWRRVKYGSYNFSLDYSITISISAYDMSETFSSKIGITFKPTLQPDEIEEYFNATFAGKMHPFINNMSIKAEDMLASRELLSNAHRNTERLTFWNAAERKSFNSLPYWARQLAIYFYIQPGDYSDRIELRMYRLPNDPDYKPDIDDDGVMHIGSSADKFTLCAPNMDNLRAGLEYYKRTGDSEGAYDVAMDY